MAELLQRFPPAGKLILVGRVWNQVNSELQRYIEYLVQAAMGNITTQTNINTDLVNLTETVNILPASSDSILAGQIFGF